MSTGASPRDSAFQTARPIRIGDIRGGLIPALAPGQLVFHLDGHEWRLTPVALPDDTCLLMFKDATNGISTYGGYRTLNCSTFADGEWTVLDFNLAANPPCAYSPYTLCPLPPPENRLATAVEAGEKSMTPDQ